MDIKEIAERVSKRIYVEDGLLLSKFISEKFAEALIESYKAELLKEVGEPVAELVLCISANGLGTEWRTNESAWWSAVEPERRAKVFTSDKLAAAQLREKVLKDALNDVGRALDAKFYIGDFKAMKAIGEIVSEALSIPRDTSALDAYVAEKVKEYGDEVASQKHCYAEAVAHYEKQLAAEQLNNKLLRKALENHSGNYKLSKAECRVINELIDKSASTEALDKYVAEKMKELDEANEHHRQLARVSRDNELKVTKQRDLAVEAIRHCIAAMGSVTDVKKVMDWPQLHNAQMLSLQALDAIKESEGK